MPSLHTILAALAATTCLLPTPASAAKACPPLGPVLPAPRKPSSSAASSLSKATASLAALLDARVGSLNGSAVSVGVKSLHEDAHLFSYHHTPRDSLSDIGEVGDDTIYRVGSVSKMVPILETDGHFMGESMDIVAHVDALDGHPLLTGPTRPETGQWLRDAQQAFIRLALPRFAAAPFAEFATTGARLYFIENKEAMIGPFSTCLAESAALRVSVNADLARLARLIQRPDAVNGTLSTDDIHLFAHLRSLTIVAGLDWPMPVRAYCQHMSQATGIPLLDHMAA